MEYYPLPCSRIKQNKGILSFPTISARTRKNNCHASSHIYFLETPCSGLHLYLYKYPLLLKDFIQNVLQHWKNETVSQFTLS